MACLALEKNIIHLTQKCKKMYFISIPRVFKQKRASWKKIVECSWTQKMNIERQNASNLSYSSKNIKNKDKTSVLAPNPELPFN